jgi:DNA-binding NarL/FixJ family response regulator
VAKKRTRTGTGQARRPKPLTPAPQQDGVPPADPALAARLAALTSREREVLAVFLDVCHDKGVAQRLGRNVHTIRNQVTSIMHKLAVASRSELIKTCLASKTATLRRS